MKSYQFSLPDEFAAFVDRMLAEKRFDSVDHLVWYAVSRVEDEIRAEAGMDIEQLRKEIQVGLDQSKRGEVGPLNMAAIWERVTARLASEQEPAHASGDADRPS